MRRLVAYLIFPVALAARPATGLEFVGIAIAKGDAQFAVANSATGSTRWVRVGETCPEYSVVEYRAADESLVLKSDGGIEVLRLRAARVATTDADSAGPMESAKAEVLSRDGWASAIECTAFRIYSGEWRIVVDHEIDGRIESRVIIVSQQGAVVRYSKC